MFTKRSTSVTGLTFFLDESDNEIAVPLKERYEFFNTGKTTKGLPRIFTSMKPFRHLAYSGNYREKGEPFITSHNLVDKFFSLSKSNHALGKQLLHQRLVDLVTAAETDVSKGTEQRMSDLKENWLKEKWLAFLRITYLVKRRIFRCFKTSL